MNGNGAWVARRLAVCGLLFLLCVSNAAAVRGTTAADSDGDGLPDTLEQALLAQFAPRFMVGQGDCSDEPSEFKAGVKRPTPQAQNGTIYGQVFPAKGAAAG